MFGHGSTSSPRTVESHDFPVSPERRSSVRPELVEGSLSLTHAHSELFKGEIQTDAINPTYHSDSWIPSSNSFDPLDLMKTYFVCLHISFTFLHYFLINRKLCGVSLTKPFSCHSCGGGNPENRLSSAMKSSICTHASSRRFSR